MRYKGLLAVVVILALFFPAVAWAVDNPQNGNIGIEGQIPAKPPSNAPTITTPKSGQAFSAIPVTVSGLCTTDLMVEIFKNNVFAGSTNCVNGSFNLQIDLFSQRNDLVARQYDTLNQASPDSNTVTVTFNDNLPEGGPRISLTTEFAKRGAQPNDLLTWPVVLSGGTGPYAISVDWGDKTAPDLISRSTPGEIELTHRYAQSGVYNVTIKATDSKGAGAFLQLVGIGNGPVKQSSASSNNTVVVTKNNNLIVPIAIFVFTTFVAFWLGRQHQLQAIRENIRQGKQPL